MASPPVLPRTARACGNRMETPCGPGGHSKDRNLRRCAENHVQDSQPTPVTQGQALQHGRQAAQNRVIGCTGALPGGTFAAITGVLPAAVRSPRGASGLITVVRVRVSSIYRHPPVPGR